MWLGYEHAGLKNVGLNMFVETKAVKRNLIKFHLTGFALLGDIELIINLFVLGTVLQLSS